MRAIETRWRGWWFRSRLEARWAVFFTTLGIKWEYEPQGFELSDGSRYLPDFEIPSGVGGGGRLLVEVKPGMSFSDEVFAKSIQLASEGQQILCVWGAPDPDVSYRLLFPAYRYEERIGPSAQFPGCRCIVGYTEHLIGYDELHARFSANQEILRYAGDPTPGGAEACALLHARDAARGARFEHGESP